MEINRMKNTIHVLESSKTHYVLQNLYINCQYIVPIEYKDQLPDKIKNKKEHKHIKELLKENRIMCPPDFEIIFKD